MYSHTIRKSDRDSCQSGRFDPDSFLAQMNGTGFHMC